MDCWQRDQFDKIKESLPFNHVLCVHEVSENCQCNYQNKMQSQYFLMSEMEFRYCMQRNYFEMEQDDTASVSIKQSCNGCHKK